MAYCPRHARLPKGHSILDEPGIFTGIGVIRSLSWAFCQASWHRACHGSSC